MYDSIFLSSFGSNIFETVGALESVKDELRKTVIWNSIGSSSLIIFLKILGFNFSQTFEHLKNFNLAHTFINGYCIIPEDEDAKRDYISEWLNEKIEINNLISNETTLAEIFKLTNIFPNFVVWSRSGEELRCLNPKTTPKMTIIDSVLATLTCIGVHSEFSKNDDTFAGYFCGSFYPYQKNFTLDKKEVKTLFIGHRSSAFFNELETESPFSYIENEMIKQFTDCNNSLIESISLENLMIIHNDIYRKSMTTLKKDFCYENGKVQGNNFISGLSNAEYYRIKKLEIMNQN